MTPTCPDCPGWDPILRRLDVTIRGIDPRVSILSVKEKHGTLQVDVGSAPFAVHDAVERAETESELTCQLCGKPGTQTTRDRWIVTRCPAC